MTDPSAPRPPAIARWRDAAIQRFRTRDPQHLSVKRSARAAVVVPGVFAITHFGFSNSQISLLAVFGSFGLTLLVDFPGRPRTRLASYVVYFAVACGFVAVGTIASTNKAAAVIAMALVAFAVLFVGIASPRAAAASTAALLAFVLSVAVAAPDSAVGPRLLGLLIAGAICIPASLLVWPTPWHDNVRTRLSATVTAVANLVAAHAAGRRDSNLMADLNTELKRLTDEVSRAPYPAAGAAAAAVNLARLVGRVEWVATNAAISISDEATIALPSVQAVLAATAETLFRCASLISDGSDPVDDPGSVDAVRDSSSRLDRLLSIELDAEIATMIYPDAESSNDRGRAERGTDKFSDSIATDLDPSFRARTLGVATAMMADVTLEASNVPPVRLRETSLTAITSHFVWRQLASHLSFQSVWFRNALRGAIGLGLAVTVVEVTNVEHGFWVVLGALSVLRSNALDTGSTAVRAIGGTAVGFAIGGAIMIGVGSHLTLLWFILPIGAFAAGVAPVLISFAASQAAFTIMLIILFNIIAPVGWTIGLTRVEDVAIGAGISLAVGVLFWPRGATAALGRALSEALNKNSTYLAYAVDRLTTATRHIDTSFAARDVNAAYLRLSDAFRQFLSERGTKVVPPDAARVGLDRRGRVTRFMRVESTLVRELCRVAYGRSPIARPASSPR